MNEPAYIICPITAPDLERVSRACWDSRDIQLRILETQDILGFAAWQGEYCIGSLHCYRVTLPAYDDALFPGYGRAKPEGWPLGWPLLAAQELGLTFDGPVWGHACFHVGYAGPDAARADRSYFGRGIGTALCEASLAWAREHGYAAVLAQGGAKVAPEYNVWMGCLPWTTYTRLGFECLANEVKGTELPWWMQAGDIPAVQEQARRALEQGCSAQDLGTRLMLLRL